MPSDSSSEGSSEASSNSSGCQCTCLRAISDGIIHGLEYVFYHLGYLIARRPWVAMLCCVLFTGAMFPGIPLFFYEEESRHKLFVPQDSQVIKDMKFVRKNFPFAYRVAFMTIEDENVLTPSIIQGMLRIDKKVKDIVSVSGYDWTTLCARMYNVAPSPFIRLLSSSTWYEVLDIRGSNDFRMKLYGPNSNSKSNGIWLKDAVGYRQGPHCWSNSLLELWSYDETRIGALTQEDILTTINTVTHSPVYQNPYNVSAVLGGIVTNGTYISAARATSAMWVISQNTTDTSEEHIKNIEDWEKQYLEVGEKGDQNIDGVYYYAERSFDDWNSVTLSGDFVLLGVGYGIVSLFVIIVIGRFTHVHQRIWVSFGAVFCIALALGVSFGFCSYLKLLYGPVHSVLPFLFVGIGIDDTFVICNALDKLGPTPPNMEWGGTELRERIGKALKQAGVAITVTSLTDILAFGVGASTVLPALRSFCVYATVGIFAVYIFQATFVVGCLTYDEYRRSHSMNACCFCHTHEEYEPMECSEKSAAQSVFDKFYGPLLVKLPMKIVVILVTLGLLAVGIWGTINLETNFDFVWFFPRGSYAKQYWEKSRAYFPENGEVSYVYYTDTVNYYEDYNNLKQIPLTMSEDEYINPLTVDCWYHSFREWTNTSTYPFVRAYVDSDGNPLNENMYYELLQRFIQMEGARFQAHVIFTADDPPLIEISRMQFLYRHLEDAAEEISAMDATRDIVAANRGHYEYEDVFAYNFRYMDFETNKIIQKELYRNLGFAFLCVFVMTLLLLANLPSCFLVCLCVIMSLVDVGACMHFWGLTVDSVTSINLTIAIGLTVDYSAHIAHAFMMESGSRNERTKKTMSTIGPAVFFGAFSTFLAFLLLFASSSYIFDVFSKVFFLVVVFGVFHGMMFLPVVLSLIGPAAHGKKDGDSKEDPKDTSQGNLGYKNGSVHIANDKPLLGNPQVA